MWNKKCGPLSIVNDATFGVGNGLKAYWNAGALDGKKPANGAATAATWNDLTGNGNHGTLQNFPADGSCHVGNNTPTSPFGLAFDGTDDIIIVPHDSDLSLTASNSMTFSVLCYPTGWGGGAINAGILIGKQDGSGIEYYSYITSAIGGTEIVAFQLGGDDAVVSANNTVILNTLQLFTFVSKPAAGSDYTIEIYKNGELNNSGTVTPSFATTNKTIKIGNRHDGILGFAGNIYSVAIYNRALSASEITALDALMRPNCFRRRNRNIGEIKEWAS